MAYLSIDITLLMAVGNRRNAAGHNHALDSPRCCSSLENAQRAFHRRLDQKVLVFGLLNWERAGRMNDVGHTGKSGSPAVVLEQIGLHKLQTGVSIVQCLEWSDFDFITGVANGATNCPASREQRSNNMCSEKPGGTRNQDQRGR